MRHRGFTLVEILVVLAILLVLSGLLLPTLVGSRTRAAEKEVLMFLKGLQTSLMQAEATGLPWADGSMTAADSAEVLHKALSTESGDLEPYPFKEADLQDTDGDGIYEVVDRWKNPVRYYRRFSTDKIKNRPIVISAGRDGVHEDARQGSDDITSWD
jgi:prepilin-type N-terminal cleavage/methylation domain-containing protein